MPPSPPIRTCKRNARCLPAASPSGWDMECCLAACGVLAFCTCLVPQPPLVQDPTFVLLWNGDRADLEK